MEQEDVLLDEIMEICINRLLGVVSIDHSVPESTCFLVPEHCKF